jgi:hypothetical protein
MIDVCQKYDGKTDVCQRHDGKTDVCQRHDGKTDVCQRYDGKTDVCQRHDGKTAGLETPNFDNSQLIASTQKMNSQFLKTTCNFKIKASRKNKLKCLLLYFTTVICFGQNSQMLYGH